MHWGVWLLMLQISSNGQQLPQSLPGTFRMEATLESACRLIMKTCKYYIEQMVPNPDMENVYGNHIKTNLSGIWTWDQSNCIIYLNLIYQCLRPLSHYGWTELPEWELNPLNLVQLKWPARKLGRDSPTFLLWETFIVFSRGTGDTFKKKHTFH